MPTGMGSEARRIPFPATRGAPAAPTRAQQPRAQAAIPRQLALLRSPHRPLCGPHGRDMFGPAMKKAKPLPHRNRQRSARYRAKLKAKSRKVRLRRSRGERRYP